MDYKPLEELVESIRKDVVAYYSEKGIDGLMNINTILTAKNFTLGHWIAVYQFERDSLEAEYDHNRSRSFMKYKEEGATDKLADAKAKSDWYDMKKAHILASKNYTLARLTHGNVEKLLDGSRTAISIKKKELDTLNDTKGNI